MADRIVRDFMRRIPALTNEEIHELAQVIKRESRRRQANEVERIWARSTILWWCPYEARFSHAYRREGATQPRFAYSLCRKVTHRPARLVANRGTKNPPEGLDTCPRCLGVIRAAGEAKEENKETT